jgi:S-DNA-T family DNA segregation ATPase FtsK/SpoIIIE
MPNRPVFQRAPRLFPELPSGELEIPAPPAVPTKPSTPLAQVVLPAVLAVGMLVATLYFAGQTSQSSQGMMAMSFGFTVLSSLVSVFNYISQGRGYQKAMREREERYRALLASKQEQLVAMSQQQRNGICQMNPDPVECLQRVESLDRSLWERAPKDSDFLALRLGLGKEPLRVKVKVPKQEGALEPDPLLVDAQALANQFAQVDQQPIQLSLPGAGAVGLVGPRSEVLNAVRASCLQLAAHHSPDEVKIVAVFPQGEDSEWNWLRWLPHTWSDDRQHRFLASSRDAAHTLLTSLHDLLARRREMVRLAATESAEAPLPFFVFFLGDPQLAENEPLLPVLLREGPKLGALSVFLADSLEALPKGCQVVTEVGPNYGRLIQTGPEAGQVLFAPDAAPVELAERLARSMAPVELVRMAASSEVPNSVLLLDLLGAATVGDLSVQSRWQSSDPSRTLATPLGLRTGGKPLALDLHERAHGPHGLVAGTTGSGKSELLQSLLVSLAVNFHPHEVVFVVVDYKGGGMANALADLPHLVGTITNLQGNLATRALFALKSELQRRQAVLAQVGVNHIDAYQRKRRLGEVREPLPHLVIVIDEFAELASEQPDFMRELVSAVRVGRSLGVHLILATQKPAGVVNEQIWSNSRFRLCLRVERPEDSQEVLKRPEAAAITRPGRAYLQVGNNELFELFQAAYGGAPYLPQGVTPGERGKVLEVTLDGSRHDLRLSPKPVAVQAPLTQLQAVVQQVKEAASSENASRLAGPWSPPLPDAVILDDLRRGAGGWDGQAWQPSPWLEPIAGLVDDPRHQYQGPLSIPLGKEGHLAIYGAPGSGKTTLVQTLITSLALAHTPEEVNLYLLDFGGRLLTLFEPLPHVGGVVLADDADRLERLLRFLRRELEMRKDRFAAAGVGTLEAYRRATGEAVPAIVVILDNYNSFATTYPDAEEQLGPLTREGGGLGIQLVLTATSTSSVKTRVSGNITLAVALQLADRSEYSMVVGRTEGLEPAPIPGRGLMKGTPPLEFQTALPVAGRGEAERTAGLKALIKQMAGAWQGPHARPIPVLPDVVPLADLVPPGDSWVPVPADGSLAVPIGLDVDVLDPVVVDLSEGPHFLITGSAQCGKTTFLQTWLLALAERFSPQRLQLYLVDFRQAGLFPLQRLPHVKSYITTDDRLAEELTQISQQLQGRRQALEKARRDAGGMLDERAFLVRYPALVVAVDDLYVFVTETQESTKGRFEQMVRRERGLGLHILVAGAASDVGGSWEAVAKAVKEMQTGFLLGTTERDCLQLLNIKLPYGEADKALSPGQGCFARRGRQCKVKVASAQVGQLTLANWAERLHQRGKTLGSEG